MRVLFAAFNLLSVLVGAQDVSTLPQCGQYCVNTVGNQAVAEAHCNVNHANCYCTRYDFVTRVDSCANSTCNSTSDSAVIDAWVHGYCGDAGSSSGTTLTYTSTTLQTSVSPTVSTAASSSSSSSSSPSTSDSNSSGGGGLSTGAKAGIGVGVPVGVLSLAGLGFAALWYRRKKRGAAGGAGAGAGGSDEEPKEQIHEVEASQVVGELAGKERHQRPIVQTPVHELPAGDYVSGGATVEERR